MTIEKPREIAVRLLLRRRTGNDYTESLLEKELAGSKMGGADRGLLQELVCGVVRWESALDWLAAQKAERSSGKPVVDELLRLGLYQMFWLDRIPDHAAVNETVELAKMFGAEAQSGFINAVLRNCLREREALETALEELKTEQPAVAWSHPQWLYERWRQRWESWQVRALMEWNNQPPLTYARVNLPRANIDTLRMQWDRENVEAVLIPNPGWLGGSLVYQLRNHPPLTSLPSFTGGGYYIQDPSTLFASRELAPAPGESVLDYCASPGGKMAHMAELMGGQGRIVAHDVSPQRLKLIRENVTRLALPCVEVVETEALSAMAPGTFDRVLVDAPCSNTGVMRRRVDLRWRIKIEEMDRLREAQLRILQQAAVHVKAGGTLVYSTCSLEPEENGLLVREFLKQRPSFHLQTERALLPFVEKVDGAYVARMVRGV